MHRPIRWLAYLLLVVMATNGACASDDSDAVVAGQDPTATTGVTLDPDTPVDDDDSGDVPGDPDVDPGDPGDIDPFPGDPNPVDPAPGAEPGVPGDGWERIEPTDDLVYPVVATPADLVADPADARGVLVRFYGGIPECSGARATVVEQSDQQVTIRLEVGGQPDLPADVACIEIAVAQELHVTLDAPLDDRPLRAATD